MKRRTILQAPALLCLPSAGARAGVPGQADPLHRPGRGRGRQRHDRARRHRALGQALGQNFIVENQGGGGGVIAGRRRRAAPDGYTLMQGYVATHGRRRRRASVRTTRSRTSRRSA